jgi:hypothetical protein
MYSKLMAICGLKVVNAELSMDDAGMCFENGTSLAIYNKHKLIGFNHGDAHILIGKTVSDVEMENDTIKIKFEKKLEIQIDMREDAYTGPEALQLRVLGEPIVIWN